MKRFTDDTDMFVNTTNAGTYAKWVATDSITTKGEVEVYELGGDAD